MLVGREKRTFLMLAHGYLRNMGVHGKVVLKSDQEHPILNVLNDVCKQRGKESDSAVTLVASSPKGESQSNGIVEGAVQDLEEGV